MKINEYKWKSLPKVNTPATPPRIRNADVNFDKAVWYTVTKAFSTWTQVFPVKRTNWTVRVYASVWSGRHSIGETNWITTTCMTWSKTWDSASWTFNIAGHLLFDWTIVNTLWNKATFVWFTQWWIKLNFTSASWTLKLGIIG